MLDILKNFDDAATGNKPAASSQDSSDMKKILESFYNVKPKETIKEAVSVTADSPDELASLVKLMGHGGEVAHSGPSQEPDMAQMRAMVSSPCGMGEEEFDEDQWENTPEPDYKDDDYMIHDLSGGINRKKKQYAKAQDGDNAMAVESIKDQLWAALNEKKTTEGKYKSDAQRKAVHAAKSKKKTESDVDEGERHGNSSMYDKCWDGYERVPGKKRGEKGSCRKK